MKKLTLFYLGILMVFAMGEGANAQVARPESNSGKGFFVLDGKLYDASGNEFIPIGANTAVFWQSETNGMKSFPDMKKAGANSARIVSVTNNSANSWSWQSNFTKQKACVKACVDNKLVPIRTAGIKNTILIDAGGCGQNPDTLINYAQELLDSDPEKNILFAIHFYGLWMTKEKSKQSWQFYVEDYLQQFKTKKIPVIVGEFGWTGAPDNFTLYDPKKIITESNKHGIGWLFWAWNSNPNETYYDIVANYTKGYSTEADLTEHGKFIVQQFKDNAKEAKSFLPTSSSMIDLEASPSIWVFPNPLTSKVLNVDFRNIEREKIKQIQLKNILGTTVKDFHPESALTGQLVLDGIAPGTYFLCFRNGQERFTSKLLITN
ncbi:MAG: cellulase family glycosylhydrolase [Bacteroidota bacterium]|nr:cellulase family glycosylhydrolase [Bacteroidota bacterium]